MILVWNVAYTNSWQASLHSPIIVRLTQLLSIKSTISIKDQRLYDIWAAWVSIHNERYKLFLYSFSTCTPTFQHKNSMGIAYALHEFIFTSHFYCYILKHSRAFMAALLPLTLQKKPSNKALVSIVQMVSKPKETQSIFHNFFTDLLSVYTKDKKRRTN